MRNPRRLFAGLDAAALFILGIAGPKANATTIHFDGCSARSIITNEIFAHPVCQRDKYRTSLKKSQFPAHSWRECRANHVEPIHRQLPIHQGSLPTQIEKETTAKKEKLA
jgi:hypothetical protein